MGWREEIALKEKKLYKSEMISIIAFRRNNYINQLLVVFDNIFDFQ